MPVVEHTELFKRSIGEVTDIVEKEMYTFEDRNGDSLTLRPEGTAGACVQRKSMGCSLIRPGGFGTRVRCSGMSGRRKAVTASFIRLVWNASVWPALTLMPSC